MAAAHYAVRIIPAYAGSTPSAPGTRFSGRDHPRIRGEHVAWCQVAGGVGGSSPHTRGARLSSSRRPARFRIIPAYAGSTFALSNVSRRDQDHPRIRGEHLNERAARQRRKGSSPHTRGARHDKPPPVVGGRIIPAYAGSTNRRMIGGETMRDHPRIRGEHASRSSVIRPIGGSSPHTRGALIAGTKRLHEMRIIPAYAGSTCRKPSFRRSSGDHPRIRGEHFIKYGIVPSSEGSSPHTRGAPPRLRRRHPKARIIPAYAGST